MLFDEQVSRFRDVFGVAIRNYYGGRELGTIAAQREPGGPLDLLRPFLFVELIGEDGAPVEPGQPAPLAIGAQALDPEDRGERAFAS
jgi:acyl-coenzyme A synthetase/AMP-(fatty) acid ligase